MSNLIYVYEEKKEKANNNYHLKVNRMGQCAVFFFFIFDCYMLKLGLIARNDWVIHSNLNTIASIISNQLQQQKE